ncbi:ferritin-like fold-containing protein [Glycomyces xiaoerkulensis]|uniref:ferritin-like fold-containing protein n=1 Tax=Glycomyces xiaoerkulensis TaxID=2038139 RepID=UPI000C25CC77|nr:ferritin-like fold-containing protein [Glycomyces xiaoerkulensis]
MSEPTDQSGPGQWRPSREAVIDLLGLLALGELLAFERMAVDARLAPDLGRRAHLSEAAVGEIRNFRLLADRLTELGVEPADAMDPFREAFRAFDAKTAPRDWFEALVKVYVGDAVADDFFRAVAARLDDADRRLIDQVLAEGTAAEFAAGEIRAAVEDDPTASGRLSLWARRLVGEGINRAQAVASTHESLADLIGGDDSFESVLRVLTRAHQERMRSVGLNN